MSSSENDLFDSQEEDLFGGTFEVTPDKDPAVRVSTLKVSQDLLPVTANETNIDWYGEPGLLIQVRGGDGELRYLAFESEYKLAFLAECKRVANPDYERFNKIAVPMCIPMIDETEGFVYLVRGGLSKWRRCLKAAVESFRRLHFTVVEVTVVSIGIDTSAQILNKKGIVVSNERLLEKLQTTIERMRQRGDIRNSRYVSERPMKKGAHRMHVVSPDIPVRKEHDEVINRPAPREPKTVKQLKQRAQRNAKQRNDPVKRPTKRVRT